MIWEISEDKPQIEGLDADGRPDPAYAASLGLVRAPFGRRAVAALLDVSIWLILMLPLLLGSTPLLLKLASGSISPYGFVNHPDFVLAVVMASVSTFLALVLLVVQLILQGRKGMTIGKAVAGLRSVNVRTLERPGVGAVLVRFVIVVAAGVVPILGPAFILISPVFDPDGRGRGLHDKATGLWLVDARKGLDPYDPKRMRIARKAVKTEPAVERSALPSLATPTDPESQPVYRPGNRVSAGVLGVARPNEQRPRSAAPSPKPEPPTRYGLRFESGETVPIVDLALLGRNPDAAEQPGAIAIALADDSRSLSKTHVLIRPVAQGLEVTDWHSTNGSALMRSGAEMLLAADRPVLVVEGDRIRLGDRVAQVVRV